MTRHTTRCDQCGWTGVGKSEALAAKGLRMHSCEKFRRREAARARGRARMAAVDRTPKPCPHPNAQHQHGTYACYTLDSCRCGPCCTAQSSYTAELNRRHAESTWNPARSPFVDAEPARAHVNALRDQGMGAKRIAAAAGISNGAMTKLLYGTYVTTGMGKSAGRYGSGELRRGPSERVRRETAERLLAVRLELGPGNRVPAVGSVRRIRALVALGWSQSKLAQRLGIRPTNLHLARGCPSTTYATALAVRALYDELSMTLPPQATHRDKIAANRARAYAAERGWLPPLALDEDRLDDPFYEIESILPEAPAHDDVDEVAVWRRLHGDKSVRLTRAEQAEVIERGLAEGWSKADIERRTGLNPFRKLQVAS